MESEAAAWGWEDGTLDAEAGRPPRHARMAATGEQLLYELAYRQGYEATLRRITEEGT